MTYIEFFEKNAVENICSSLAKEPDRVILIGNDRDDNKGKKKNRDPNAYIKRYADICRDILHARGVDAEVIPLPVKRDEIQTVIDTLSQIVETCDDCVFDLTGGDDLYLVAVGIVFERYKNRYNIQMHRLNLRQNTTVDVDQDGRMITLPPDSGLTVEENIRLYGGCIVYDEQKSGKTFRWNMTDEFKKDVNTLWELCRYNPGLWNKRIGVLSAAKQQAGDTGDGTTLTVPASLAQEMLGNERDSEKFGRFLNQLLQKRLLKSLVDQDGDYTVSFKDAQIGRCLTTEGLALEMKVFLIASDMQGSDGSKVYGDVMNGVHIDWDGDLHSDQTVIDTENEIDVMMMHGMIPVFVSCKNGTIRKKSEKNGKVQQGSFGIDELYKLNTVASRFGGNYAKRVLVATSLGQSVAAKNFRQRAADMGIRLVEEFGGKLITDWTDADFVKALRSLWKS